MPTVGCEMAELPDGKRKGIKNGRRGGDTQTVGRGWRWHNHPQTNHSTTTGRSHGLHASTPGAAWSGAGGFHTQHSYSAESTAVVEMEEDEVVMEVNNGYHEMKKSTISGKRYMLDYEHGAHLL